MQKLQNPTSPPINAEPSLDEWLADLERHVNLALHGRGEVESQLQARALSRIAELTQSDWSAAVETALDQRLFLHKSTC